MALTAQKRTAAARTNPLDDAGILQRVLSYVPGQALPRSSQQPLEEFVR
jgi:hypothetical protein